LELNSENVPNTFDFDQIAINLLSFSKTFSRYFCMANVYADNLHCVNKSSLCIVVLVNSLVLTFLLRGISPTIG
jgi:hypothetical protein